jgi:hypothetical protein
MAECPMVVTTSVVPCPPTVVVGRSRLISPIGHQCGAGSQYVV